MNDPSRERLIAWGLLTPALLVLALFGLFPIGYALFVSLHEWRIRNVGWVGLQHYVKAVGDPAGLAGLTLAAAILWLAWRLRAWMRRTGASIAAAKLLFAALLLVGVWIGLSLGLSRLVTTGDARLYNGLRVTVFYAVGTIPVELGVSLGLAYLLFKSLRGKGAFRVLFFLPYVTPVIASAVVFRALFSPHPSSVANRVCGLLGLTPSRWLHENRSVVALFLDALGVTGYPGWVDAAFPSLALTSIVLYNIWVYIGYDTVILLAGLSAIPRHYYEAAAIDGANPWQSFRHITVPLLSPTLFFLSMISAIGTFKAFNHIYMMRTPAALDTVDVLSVAIFDLLFQYNNAGYAATLAFLLFLAILALTLVQNRLLGRRVFYGD
jgi:multiple sugar transport system permease protein